MSTSGLFHYCRTKCVSAECAMAFIGKMEFCAKYGHRTELTCHYIQVQVQIDRTYYFVISKVRSSWKYVKFNCIFPLQWRWVRNSIAPFSHTNTSTRRCFVPNYHYYLFSMDVRSHRWNAIFPLHHSWRCNPYLTCAARELEHVCVVRRFDAQ